MMRKERSRGKIIQIEKEDTNKIVLRGGDEEEGRRRKEEGGRRRKEEGGRRKGKRKE